MIIKVKVVADVGARLLRKCDLIQRRGDGRKWDVLCVVLGGENYRRDNFFYRCTNFFYRGDNFFWLLNQFFCFKCNFS